MAQQTWSAWNTSVVWGLLIIVMTNSTHVVGIGFIVSVLERFRTRLLSPKNFIGSGPSAIAVVVAVALTLATLHGIESIIWAIGYVRLGALPSSAEATLYSVDSLTTRGASGLVLGGGWQMMGALEAGDGMLLFGISTAFLFYVMTRLWRDRPAD